LAVAGYEKALGAEHTFTLDTTNNLSFLYLDQIRLAEAEEMYKRALIGYDKAFGAVHMHTLCAVNILARVCRNRHYLHVTSINRSKVQPSLCVYKGDTPFKFIIPVCHWWIERRQARARLSEHLGHMFLSLGSLDEAVIAFEQQIDESHEGSFHSGM
jgi:tetratricopeptide (TPR) repeat protein